MRLEFDESHKYIPVYIGRFGILKNFLKELLYIVNYKMLL